ncbi:MAG: RHS repeat-associated core domain-containing protein [Cyclobacteriaceae bacterium]|nr:RHS repeat-associated core domain-containing protein [Cyclobacteriaceae bacterium HetDA_MAG_MS6]
MKYIARKLLILILGLSPLALRGQIGELNSDIYAIWVNPGQEAVTYELPINLMDFDFGYSRWIDICDCFDNITDVHAEFYQYNTLRPEPEDYYFDFPRVGSLDRISCNEQADRECIEFHDVERFTKSDFEKIREQGSDTFDLRSIAEEWNTIKSILLTNVEKSFYVGPEGVLDYDGFLDTETLIAFWDQAGKYDSLFWPSLQLSTTSEKVQVPIVISSFFEQDNTEILTGFTDNFFKRTLDEPGNYDGSVAHSFNEIDVYIERYNATVTLNRQFPSLYIGELLLDHMLTSNGPNYIRNSFLEKAAIQHLIGSRYFEFQSHGRPQKFSTYYGEVKERFRMIERIRTTDCDGQIIIYMPGHLEFGKQADQVLHDWIFKSEPCEGPSNDCYNDVLPGNFSDRSDWGIYASLDENGNPINRLPDTMRPKLKYEGFGVNAPSMELTIFDLESGGYLVFEIGDQPVIYQIALTKEVLNDLGEIETVDILSFVENEVPEGSTLQEELFDEYTNELTYVDWARIIIREDKLERFDTNPRVNDFVAYEHNTELPTDGIKKIISDEGYFRYTFGAANCQEIVTWMDPIYFYSGNIRMLMTDANGQEIHRDPSGNGFTVDREDTEITYLYTRSPIINIGNGMVRSDMITDEGSGHSVTVERYITAQQLSDTTFNSLYKYKIDITGLEFDQPSFLFQMDGETASLYINFDAHIGPKEADPIDLLLSGITVDITYEKDPETIFSEQTSLHHVSVTLFEDDPNDPQSLEARSTGFAEIDLFDLGLTPSEVGRLDATQFSADRFTLVPVYDSLTFDFFISKDNDYDDYIALNFKRTNGDSLVSREYTKSYVKFTYKNEPADFRMPSVIDKPIVLNDVLFNHDIVGQVVDISTTQPIIVEPGLKFEKGSRLVVEEITADVLFEGLEYVENRNWIRTVGRDDYGQIRSDAKAYFDDAGLLEQTQTKDFERHVVMASAVVLDELARPSVNTLTAPLRYGLKAMSPETNLDEITPGFDTYFEYEPDFIDYYSYNYRNFSGDKLFHPDALTDNQIPGTLGWYYSTNNTGSNHESHLGEDHVAQTKYPYSRKIYYDDESGDVLSTAPPGDYVWENVDESPRNGHIQYRFDNYQFLIENPAGDLEPNPGFQEGIPSRDSDAPILNLLGHQSPILDYSGGDDQALMEIYRTVRNFRFPDISESASVLQSFLGNGYKRRALDYRGNQIVSYYDGNDNMIISQTIYLDPDALTSGDDSVTTFNFYDHADQLIAAYTPEGTKTLLSNPGQWEVAEHTSYKYNLLGWLMEVNEPDAGITRYWYRRDGLIRFSQNADQAIRGRCSYTNYDVLNRPVESGEAIYDAFGVGDFEGLKALANDRSQIYSSSEESFADRFDIIRTYYDDTYAWFKNDVTDKLYADGAELSYSSGNAQHVKWAVPSVYKQDFLTGAVSHTLVVKDNLIATLNEQGRRSVYSYDERGRVTWLAQYIPGLEEMKIVKYLYGSFDNVIMVAYQPDVEGEEFYHYYEYNKNSQLARVYACDKDLMDYRYRRINRVYEEEKNQYLQASYDYYLHGPLKSVTLGPKNQDGKHLQRLDYIYGINGALKSINNVNTTAETDAMPDAFAMQLQYFNGDYLNDHDSTNYAAYTTSIEDIATDYTGNIKAAIWTHREENPTKESFVYGYDASGQLTKAIYASVSGQTLSDANSFSLSGLTYDLNGNIGKLKREGPDGNSLTATHDGHTLSHDFDYVYKSDKRNQLERVAMPGGSTYQRNTYNNTGALTQIEYLDDSEQRYGMDYEVTGKLVRYYKKETNGSQTDIVRQGYNTQGFRDTRSTMHGEEYYVRDASGSILAIYHKAIGEGSNPVQTELPIYGGDRLGTRQVAQAGTDRSYADQYELKDHLGNVRAIVGWEEHASPQNADTLSIPGQFDYYPFGMKMTQASHYRYGYQGQFAEEDSETGWNHFEARDYDPVIGRWMAVDPNRQHWSPYLSMSNNPIMSVDPDGRDDIYYRNGTEHSRIKNDNPHRYYEQRVDSDFASGFETVQISNPIKNPSVLEANNFTGYVYSAADLQVRNSLMGLGSNFIKAKMLEWESTGNFQPLSNEEYRGAYIKRWGTDKAFWMAIEEGYWGLPGDAGQSGSAAAYRAMNGVGKVPGLVKIGQARLGKVSFKPNHSVHGKVRVNSKANRWNRWQSANKGNMTKQQMQRSYNNFFR